MEKCFNHNSIYSIVELQEKYNEWGHLKIKSLLLNDLIKATDDDGYLPTSFDIRSHSYNYDLIKGVLYDIGIAPIQIRAIFMKRFDVYHIQLSCRIQLFR